MTVCPSCGHENRAGARFCDSCGSPLVAAEVRELRKVVTILFCDVTGSTALGERLDAESLRSVMERYFSVARDVLERHGGTVEKFIGDAVMAVFGIPRVHEDDALRAARAADELRTEIGVLSAALREEYDTELQVRIGVNTGEVVTSEGGTLATGDAVNIGARLEQAAQPGEILVGEETRRLAADALELEAVEPVEAKGKSNRLMAYRLLGVRTDAPAFARRFDTPFVGRQGELAQLRQAFERALRDRACHLFTLLGPAGIGKSRLTQEFLAENEDALVLRGHCLSYGEGITYFPLVEILEALALDEEASALLRQDAEARSMLNAVTAAAGLADAPTVSREDTFHAVRTFFERLGRRRPLIVVLDDLHWAEETFLDLVEYLADWSRDAPIFLLCPARPDLLDARPTWAGGKLNATTTLLEPLSEEEAETLIDNLLAGVSLSDAVRVRISDTAEGNPLFVEQMLALIAQNGHGGEIEVPPTIQALLATRLEQLPVVERVAAERASVIGKEFWRAALVEIGGDASSLPALIRKELIRPHMSPVFPTDDAFRFRHQLIRDAAYDGMPKELRAELHEGFGRWLETNRSEYDEIVGYHFEQGYRLRTELGSMDAKASELSERAGALLGRAGERAYDRGDTPAAVNLLTRSAGLLPESDERRLAHLIRLGYALFDAGQLESAAVTFERAIADAERAGAAAIVSRGSIGSVLVDTLKGGGFEEPLALVEAQLAQLEEHGDDVGRAEGSYVAGLLMSWLGRSEEANAAFEGAVTRAELAGDRRLQLLPMGAKVLMNSWGYLPVEQGLRNCDELLVRHRTTSVEPWIRTARALYLGLDGDHGGARVEMQRARELYLEYGNELLAAASSLSSAYLETNAGRPDAAESIARAGAERLQQFGEQGFYSSTIGMLAEALYRQGRYDDADQWAHAIAEVAMENDYEPHTTKPRRSSASLPKWRVRRTHIW
ncbi:MAG: zinc-ribbon domain-containing protein [Actinobacteria bacterium]|nr:MAG: zinc-ribbon domain-containing protein [Actinomycetota bacterium]